VCYYSFTTVSDYSSFRNVQGVSADFFKTLPINYYLLLLATYLNYTAFFMLPLHFYYLVKRKYFYSILSLIFSLNIILEGIAIFSRSAMVLYLMLYLLYFIIFYTKIDIKRRSYILISALIILFFAGDVFARITTNRFDDYTVETQFFVDNPQLYSVFDYIGQWYQNCNKVMSRYSFTTLNGELSFPFILVIANNLHLINYEPSMIESTLYAIWGDNFDKFNGIISNLLFDFGYIGTTMFTLLYYFVLRKLWPVQGAISFNKLLMLGTLFALPAMGIFNFYMKLANYNVLIVYSIIVYIYMSRNTKVYIDR